MSRGISLEKVEEAICAAENEREIRRRMFTGDSNKQHRKVRDMNVVLDILRWGRRLLVILDEGPRGLTSSQDAYRVRSVSSVRELDGRQR